jgi:hypothetical protein
MCDEVIYSLAALAGVRPQIEVGIIRIGVNFDKPHWLAASGTDRRLGCLRHGRRIGLVRTRHEEFTGGSAIGLSAAGA